MLEQGLYQLLTTNLAVAVYHGKLGGAYQKYVLPAIVIQAIPTSQFVTMAEGTATVQAKRIQFDCYGATPLDAQNLERSLKALIKDMREQTLGDGTRVISVLPQLEYDLPPEEGVGTGPQIFRTLLDALIWHVEPVVV